MTFLMTVTTTLAQGPRANAQFGRNSCVRRNPVCERILAILNDCLGGFIPVVCSAGLAWGDWGVIDKLEEMFAVTCDDSKFFAVFAESVELVGVGCLELLTSDVGELGFGNEGFGFCADELLFENDNFGGIGLFVFELGDLIGDFLLA